MKTQSARRAHGFTLVELLVVIAIIAVLAGAGFAAGNAAIQKAKKTTALATCTALESAINNFYTEYGAMPSNSPSGATSDETIVTKGDILFLKVLLGIEAEGANMQNPRKIKFLSVKEGKANKNGIMYNTAGTAVSGLYDPWGGNYNVILDADYDEKVKPAPSAGGAAVTLNGRRAAAWSNGADAISNSGGRATDDVKTW
jgi:prepilin-type N-terminal cleavage/methylation domain-containing protein